MKIGIVLMLILISGFSNAQVQEQLTPTEKKYQSVVTEPLTTYKGFFRVGIGGSFSVADKMFTSTGKKTLIESNGSGSIWNISTFIQYGVTDRLQVEIQLPYQRQTLTLSSVFELPEADSVFTDRYSNPTKGFGDMSATLAYQLVQGDYTKPFLGIFITANLPTAEKNPTNVNPKNPSSYNAATGSGEFSLETTMKYRKIVFPYSFDLSAGYKSNFGGTKFFSPIDKGETSFKTGNKINVNGSFNIHLNNWIIMKSTADFSFFGGGVRDGKSGDTSWLLMLYPGLNFQLKGFRIATAVAYPALGKSSLADPLYVTNFLYTF